MNSKKFIVFFFTLSYLFFLPKIHATINVGIPYYNPPFVLNQDEGFDIAIMRTICTRLKENCVFYPMLFHKLYAALDKGEIDIAVGGITISEARKTHYLFSLPYMASNGKFLTLKNTTIQTTDDLATKKVGALRGSDYEEFLANTYGLKFQIVPYSAATSMMDALNRGDIDAVFLDDVAVNFWCMQSDGLFTSLGDREIIGSGFAIMTTPQNSAIIQSINKILMQMESDGTYKSIYNSYFSNYQ
ncbi:transporter substrate-binding domain-containing protein [Legionella hackeliae]|uniref:Solute-binding protein family 3/N-terminal domain-containing protein n=1 Tax=Legionella hackeliae TaxID=449 RepID=A0A0A8UUW3_LEGHA|nr:transporter substrate-binding domain-containing protein [Legionella hackeliae]KTD13873.1 arginine ABC transporter substrate-binding protein [Legionella hackeliae]CEK10574.1 exported protein of unknown function [Legionella hackeliae]STX47314.1 arginine ABC transporter substrate-binding protein [Legionella hackeliae]